MAVVSCFLGLIKTNSGSRSRNVRRSLSVLFATAIGISSQLVSAAPGDLLQRIDNPNAARNDFFGSHSITLPDGNIIVGAYLDDGVVSNSGIAYVFDQAGMLLQTIDNPSPGVSDFFGATMDFYNNELYVSSWRSDIGADDSGVIHVFDGTNFNFQRTIQNPTPEFRDGFGRVFAFSPNGDLFVAAPEDDNLERDDGAVYQINPATGALIDTILNPEPGNSDRFGAALAVTPEGNIWVGAPNDNTTNINGGSAYLFDGSTKELLLTLNNPTIDRDEYFGATILPYQNGGVAIAAYGYKGDGSTAGGRIYIYNAAGQLLRTVDNPSTFNIGGFGLYMVLDNNENIITRTNDTSATPENEGALFRIDSETGAIEQVLVNPFHESPTYFAQHITLDTNNDLWVSDQFQTNANGERGGATYKFEGVPTIPTAADNQPPVLYPPEEQLAESEFLSGAIVEYPYTFAADDVSVPLIANCFPTSGSLFPIGVTEVTCSAQDSSGNVGTTSFDVNVLFKIANPIQTNSARFGSAIAINSAGNIIIGDYQQDVNLRSEGILHEFTPEGTQLVPQIINTFKFGQYLNGYPLPVD